MTSRMVCVPVLVCAYARIAGAAADPIVLAHDDGKQDSKRSMAGEGHIVEFKRPAENFALTAVRIFGSRYGGNYDPALEIAKVSICDRELKPLGSAVVALEKFPGAEPIWVEVPIGPLRPPETFYVHVDFFAAQTRGVYCGIDTGSKGHSMAGQLEKPGAALAEGDWMIRAVGTTKIKSFLVLDPASKKVLSHDDGTPDGKRSTAGAGHAVQFTPPSGEWYIGEVSIHGSMYGGNFDPTRTFFNVFICDPRLRVLSHAAHPYSLFKFKPGEAGWVTVPVPPLRTKGAFFVLVCFDPTQTKGVYVSIDAVKKSHSLSGLPNRPGGAIGPKEEWMIRAVCMKRGKGDAIAASKEPKEATGGPDAMEIARWQSSLDELEEKEDVAGIQKLLAEAKRASAKDAEALGAVHATEHVFVRSVNVPPEYPKAVAALLEVCDASLRKRFGLKDGMCVVPGKRLHVHLLAGEGKGLNLWTSPGSVMFPLVVNTMPEWKRGMSPPGKGGPHIVYGLCHELGHVVMGWEDCRHQWAHYVGSLLVEDVAAALKDKAWPQPYDIRAEGLRRFMDQVKDAKPDRATDAGTARIFFEVGEKFGLAVWGKCLAWIKANRTGKAFHAVRLYTLDDLRDALLELGSDAKEVERILGGGKAT